MINVGETSPRKGSNDNILNVVAMLCTAAILTIVLWGDEHDVAGFYQNLLLASTSLLIVAKDISDEISEKKEKSQHLSKWWNIIYMLCRVFSILCFVIPLCIYIFSQQSKSVHEHLENNTMWGICFPSVVMAVFAIVFLYLVPSIIGLPYKDNIRYEER